MTVKPMRNRLVAGTAAGPALATWSITPTSSPG